MTAQQPPPAAGEQWSRHLVELVPDLVCMCRNGSIAFINGAGAGMLGETPRRLIGKPLADFVHPDFADIVAPGLDVLTEDGDGVPLMFVRSDGGVVEVQIVAQVLRDGADAGCVIIHARDVTERTRAAQGLLRSEERYRRLVDMALDFTCVCADGVITFINAAGARLLGAAAAKIVGTRFADVVHSDYREIVDAGLGHLHDDSGPVPLKLVRADGSVRDVEMAVLPFGSSGEKAFMVEARDISERKRSAEALREREQRLQGIMDTVAEGIITADEKGIIRSVNPAALRIFGYDRPAELIGRNLSILMPEPYRSEHDGYLAAYLTTRQPKIIGLGREVIGVRKNRTTFPLELNVGELRQGRSRLFIGSVRDISLRQQAVDALRRAHDQLEARVEERTQELKQLTKQTARILDSANEGIISLDRDGRIIVANPAAAAMMSMTAEELVGRPVRDFLARADGRPLNTRLKRLPLRAALHRGLLTQQTSLGLYRKDGSCFPIEIAGAPIEDDGVMNGAVVVFRDITERRRSEEKLRLAATVFETTAEAIMVLEADGKVTAVNSAFGDITGFLHDEIVGQSVEVIAEGIDDKEAYEALWEGVTRSGRWEGELWNHRKNGEPYAMRIGVSSIRDDKGAARQFVVVFSDVTQRKLDEERILYQANYDALTGLPNRALFMDRLAQAVHMAARQDQMVGLMFIDLDGFKLVNDTLGHDVGDALLQEAGRRLQACVRTGDTVARLGGDEFTITMPNLGDFRNAPTVAQRIIDSLEQPFDLNGQEAFVSASIGITTFPNDAQDANALLKNADAAMYRAKDQGKANYQFFTADMNEQVKERLIIKNGLSKAMEREEFTLYYQPKVDLAKGRITGVEALLRWRNGEMGMVSPVKFIPILEETGLITAVGEWAIEVACAQHKAWVDEGLPPVRVAVNLSVRQLRQPNLAQIVENILVKTGIEPASLELEITESMIMKDTENAVAILRQLDTMGVHLAMDDFGTGYSSLSYLKRFPLHTIKIDRSFVNDIATDPDDLEIIRTIITMGHSLRRRIVAEGVETEEQLELLRQLRCDEIQGYLFSPPVPAAEISRMLAEGR